MNVKELIEHLKSFPEECNVLVRIEDPCGGPDYYHATKENVKLALVMNDGGEHVDAVTIGDDLV